jgi:hypothetical protein
VWLVEKKQHVFHATQQEQVQRNAVSQLTLAAVSETKQYTVLCAGTQTGNSSPRGHNRRKKIHTFVSLLTMIQQQ